MKFSRLAGVLGFALCVLYSSGVVMPLYAGVITMFLFAVLGAWAVDASALSLLPRFMVLLYALPFVVLAGSLILSDLDLLDASAVVLILQRSVAGDALAVGLVGLLGLLFGFGLVRKSGGSEPVVETAPAASVSSVPLFACVELLAVLLSGVSSRSNRSQSGSYFEDALEAAQGGGGGATLYVIAYSLVIVLCIDAQSDARSSRRTVKNMLLFSGAVYMTLFHQLFQGDREILGLILALLSLYITRVGNSSVEARRLEQRRVIRRILPIAGLTLVLFLSVGQLRYANRVAGGGILGAAIREVASGGTWTAVFLGNLGLANEHQSGSMTYLFGKTYVDYLISLPPRIVSQAFGMVRPLEGASGPGLWYYPLQWGGVHPAVVPFKNFGIWGAFAILSFYGWVIARIERCGQAPGFWGRIFFGTFFAASFNWFWYGDMPFLRALMAAAITGLAYKLVLSLGATTTLSARLAK